MSRSRMWAAAVVVGVVVTDDQVTKAAAARAGVVLHNPGYALGVVGGPAALLTIGMIVTLIAFVVTVGAFALRIGVSPVYPGLVIAGMIGNTIDRLRFGAARDFIRTPLAIVNVADLAVVFGIVLIAMALLLRVRRLAV